jgi:hypothetical protein
MTYNEFRLRFAIQYVGGVSDPGECMRRMDNAPALARLLWDVMNAPEVQTPSAPIAANSPHLIPSNSMELKALARTAREVVSDTAQWIAIDANGEVWAYDLKPTIDTPRNTWDNSDDAGFSWEISAVAPPDNFRDELYEISKLLENDNN